MKRANQNFKTTYLTPSDCCCPKCGSKRIQGISRITGYLSLDERFGAGKVKERAARKSHNSDLHTLIYSKVTNNK